MKTTKERLDELQELLRGEYITESEFRIARLNILREGGVNVVGDVDDDFDREEDMEPRRGCGCGCFLATLMLIAAIASVVYIAAPIWPASYGGQYARTAREWMEFVYTDLASYFSDRQSPAPVSADAAPEPALPVGADERESPEAAPNAVPDTVAPGDVPVVPPAASQLPASPTPVQPINESASLPPLDSRVFELPDAPGSDSLPQDLVTVVEIPSSLTDSVPVRGREGTETARRGVVSARSARIRSTPGVAATDNVVGWGSSGDRFLIMGEEIVDGTTWYNIHYVEGNKRGWISGTLVTLE